MPRSPAPLPPRLTERPLFTNGQALALGVRPGRLDAGDLDRPTWGVRRVRRLTPIPPPDRRPGPDPRLVEQARAYAVGLPADVAFCSMTAARLHGLPLPRDWTPDEPLDVIRDTDRPRIERAGCTSHRGQERRSITRVSGLRVVDPLDTWLDLASALGVSDLVAVGDALLRPRGRRMRSEVDELIARHPGARGIRTARKAAQLMRPGAASPWESIARVIFHDEGLPEPELNVDIIAADGSWLARGDFVWREARVVGEYDGDQHRTDRRRWHYERERRAGLEDEGWRYVEFTSLTLTEPRHRAALIARLEKWLAPTT